MDARYHLKRRYISSRLHGVKFLRTATFAATAVTAAISHCQSLSGVTELTAVCADVQPSGQSTDHAAIFSTTITLIRHLWSTQCHRMLAAKVHTTVSTSSDHSVLVHLAARCGINNQYISESTRRFCGHSFVQQTGCMFRHRRHPQNNVPLQYGAVAMHNVNLNLGKYIDKQKQNTEKLQ